MTSLCSKPCSKCGISDTLRCCCCHKKCCCKCVTYCEYNESNPKGTVWVNCFEIKVCKKLKLDIHSKDWIFWKPRIAKVTKLETMFRKYAVKYGYQVLIDDLDLYIILAGK